MKEDGSVIGLPTEAALVKLGKLVSDMSGSLLRRRYVRHLVFDFKRKITCGSLFWYFCSREACYFVCACIISSFSDWLAVSAQPVRQDE